MMLNGFLVIEERKWLSREADERSLEIFGLRGIDLLKRFKGLEGYPWPEFDPNVDGFEVSDEGVVDICDHTNLKRYVERISGEVPVRTVFCREVESPTDLEVPDGFEPLGFDVCFVPIGFDLYSVILDEVLFGQVPELRAFGSDLNGYLLFDEWPAARNLVAAREKLSANAGLLIEELAGDERIGVVEVFERSTHGRR